MALRSLYPSSPAARRLRVTEDEKEALRTAEGAQGTGSAVGSGVGAAIGGGLGALGFLVPGLGALTLPAGMAVGQALGGAIGGTAGGAVAADASEEASEAERKRAELLAEAELKEQALMSYTRRGR